MHYKVPTPFSFRNYFALAYEACFQAIEQHKQHNSQKELAAKNICQGFENCLRGIQGLDQTLTYLKDDIIVLFGRDIPGKLQLNTLGLQHVEEKNSSLYSSYLRSINSISKRYESLQTHFRFIILQHGKEDSWKKHSKSNIQTEIIRLKNDFITLAETELQLLECITDKYPDNKIKSKQNMKERLQKLISQKSIETALILSA